MAPILVPESVETRYDTPLRRDSGTRIFLEVGIALVSLSLLPVLNCPVVTAPSRAVVPVKDRLPAGRRL